MTPPDPTWGFPGWTACARSRTIKGRIASERLDIETLVIGLGSATVGAQPFALRVELGVAPVPAVQSNRSSR
jgi:hypothetical protein